MTLSPIIGRELRQQARRPSTIWIRTIAAMLGGLCAIATLRLAAAAGTGGVLPGKIMFNALSVVLFVICLFEGVRQTSDCLSSEKREGTLGLLLLTDLRGFDLVLGKLAAISVGSAYALMAVFPAMAMALPYGGLTGGEFWRVQLVLLVTLFFGLAVGMWASARQQQPAKALVAGFALALALTLSPMTVEVLLKRGPIPSISPGVALHLAGDLVYASSPLRFWLTVLAVHAVSWGLLALASRRLLRTWQDEERPATVQSLIDQTRSNPDTGRWAPEGEPEWTEDWSAYHNPRPASERPERALIADNPADWLAGWVPQQRFLVGLSVFLLALGTFGGGILRLLLGAVSFGGAMLPIAWVTGLLPWLFLAFVSSRPMAEARRTGALELLLSTPLAPDEIVEAHWKGLWRQLTAPFKVACVLLGVMFLFSFAQALTLGGFNEMTLFTVAQLVSCLGRIITGIAVCRMGLYCGLKASSMFTAVGQNLLWNVILPWLVMFLMGQIYLAFAPMTAGRPGNIGFPSSFWLFSFVLTGSGMIYSMLVIRWSRNRLLSRFRELASEA